MKYVVIGSGQTGRGFIAPFILQQGHELCFIDIDKKLIDLLNEKRTYTVSYCGNSRTEFIVSDYIAFNNVQPEAISAIAEADVVVTSIGSKNITDICPLLAQSIKQRVKSNKLIIITCENGINVKKPLLSNKIDAYITEGIIFCTTLRPNAGSLDLLCEDYPAIPYDQECVPELHLDTKGFIPVNRFPTLIERKIYTYNCLSACISYLGFYKGYNIYSDAANDTDIALVLDKLLAPINSALSQEYNIPLDEQIEFSRLAILKFQNHDIVDTISRNARDCTRKLGPNERMIKPLRLCIKHNQDVRYMVLVIAAALFYLEKNEDSILDPLITLSGLSDVTSLVHDTYRIQECFSKNIPLHDIFPMILDLVI